VSRVFYLTTPIYYVNAAPHLGHACTTIFADAMTRFRRLMGDDVLFLTGTDEHGDNIAQAAAKAGLTPQAFADGNAAAFREAWRALDIRYDDFIRTTEPRHAAIVREILQRLWDAGEIYLGTYGGHYCFGCERFYTEKEIVEGRCPDHRTTLTWIEEQNYFFRMSKYQEWLVGLIHDRPELIRPERYRNEILGFLRDPLTDLSISRPRTRLEWGIPLPFDDRYVTYVWFDALINYVSALGPLRGERHRKYWPHVQHLIGKDILKPHAIYWPCMLKAAGLPVFTRLNVHGYWTLGGGKMSKSVGNVVEALALKDRYGNDAFRYFVMREMAFGLDADFSEEAFVGRLNADLANDLGNLASRVTTMLATFGGGAAPAAGAPTPAEEAVARAWSRARVGVETAMEEFAFQRALAAIWEFIGVVNRYVDASQPWQLAKNPAQAPRLAEVLATLAEALRCLGAILAPFLPDAAARLRAALGDRGEPRAADLEWRGVRPGTRVEKLAGLFPRVDTARAGEGAAAATSPPTAGGGATAASTSPPTAGGGATAASTSPPTPRGEHPPVATIDDFGRLDLRVARVVAVERVPKSKKLLKVRVALDGEERTVVAGIAEHYTPEALVGKSVVIVANLEPATLMGIESRGMLLAASAGGALAVLTTERELPPGAKVT
jgi:methionyl-tRNA synthetase